jgi:hypothetical protein
VVEGVEEGLGRRDVWDLEAEAVYRRYQRVYFEGVDFQGGLFVRK